MSAPSLWSLGYTHWEWTPALDALALAAALLYGVGVLRARRWSAARTGWFLLGLAAILVATQSGYDAYDDRMLSAHMVQHLLLIEVAPLLLLAGRPVMLALRAAPRRHRPRLVRGLMRVRPLTRPLVCLAVFCGVIIGCHVPAFFDATVRHPLLHDTEHGLFLTAGLFMWWPVLDGDPLPGHRLDGLRRLTYVMVAMLPMTLIGAWLNRDPTVFYTAYLAPARALGISAVADQQLAGAIMWVLGSLVMIAAGIWQTMAALRAEVRRHERAERRADALADRGVGIS